MMANCRGYEAFRDGDRAPAKYILVDEVVKDWLCSGRRLLNRYKVPLFLPSRMGK